MKGQIQHPYEMKLIPARLIVVNRGYQRDVKASAVKKIINNFDYHEVNPVKVVNKGGTYYAVNGQHTTVGLRMKFGDDYLVPCMVYYDIDTVDEEARLFEEINTTAMGRKVSQMELWKSRIFREEPTAMAIKNIVEAHGLKLARTGKCGRNYIHALNALESAYNSLGDALFAELIDILKKAWDGDTDSLQAPIIKGLSRFIKTYDGKYRKADLVNRLRRTPAVKIICAGNASIGNGPSKFAREILNVYNSGTSVNRLPDILA